MSLSRRNFIGASAGLGFGLVLGPLIARAGAIGATGGETGVASGSTPHAWVRIAPTGAITIQTPADELGQGSMTALPLILAEELDADWNDVVIEFCTPDDDTYGNPDLAGLVLTVASWAVNSYY